MPTSLGPGMGLFIPTGNAEKGTGGDAFVAVPRLGFIFRLRDNLYILPALRYFHSFGHGDLAVQTRTASLAAPLVFVHRAALWVTWTPEVFRDLERASTAATNSLAVGKVLTPHFAMSLEYGRITRFRSEPDGGNTKLRDNLWALRFHLPFGQAPPQPN